MRQVTKIINIYKFDGSTPKGIKELIRDDIAHNWDIYGHNMCERVRTLEKLAEYIDGTLDYSLSCVADRGEFVTIKDYDKNKCNELIELKEPCPLTGMCYDDDLIESIRTSGLKNALSIYIDSIHDEYDYMLTDEYIEEFCESNDYEFTDNGKLF